MRGLPVAACPEGMVTMIIAYTDDVRNLMSMEQEMVRARDIAPILGMKPETIIKKAKAGTWDRSICNYIVSGSRVKFFRIDFLRKGGWLQ